MLQGRLTPVLDGSFEMFVWKDSQFATKPAMTVLSIPVVDRLQILKDISAFSIGWEDVTWPVLKTWLSTGHQIQYFTNTVLRESWPLFHLY